MAVLTAQSEVYRSIAELNSVESINIAVDDKRRLMYFV